MIDVRYFRCKRQECGVVFNRVVDHVLGRVTEWTCPRCRGPVDSVSKRDADLGLGELLFPRPLMDPGASGVRWPKMPGREDLEGLEVAEAAEEEVPGGWWMKPWVTWVVVVLLLVVSVMLAIASS